MSDSLRSAHTSILGRKPTWDPSKSFEWNYNNGPLLDNIPPEPLPLQSVAFLSWKLRSPLGIAAGPLPNSKFVEKYARLGYSLLTYKSVRSRAWPAHPKPILALLRPADQEDPSPSTPLFVDNEITWFSSTELSSANSVGLPSHSPKKWREDVRQARKSLGQGQLLIVSVVGTPRAGGTIRQLANDFARCARWAVDAGADMIEVNLSCPNVQSKESYVYLDPTNSKLVVETVHDAIGRVPLSAKLGYYADKALMYTVLVSIAPFLDALTLVNAVKWPVVDSKGPYFPGTDRECAGVGGAVIRKLAQDNIGSTIKFLREKDLNIPVIAVGGITQPHHVDEYLALGAVAVAIGTAAIWRPFFSYDYARFRAQHTHSPKLNNSNDCSC